LAAVTGGRLTTHYPVSTRKESPQHSESIYCSGSRPKEGQGNLKQKGEKLTVINLMDLYGLQNKEADKHSRPEPHYTVVLRQGIRKVKKKTLLILDFYSLRLTIHGFKCPSQPITVKVSPSRKSPICKAIFFFFFFLHFLNTTPLNTKTI
jgi:hypothetical protein